MNPNLLRVTQRIVERSQQTRKAYLARIEQAKTATVHRSQLACEPGAWLRRLSARGQSLAEKYVAQ